MGGCAMIGRTMINVKVAGSQTRLSPFPDNLASSNDLVYQFDYADDPDRVVIGLSSTHIRDARRCTRSCPGS
ncbi:hypothetical protein GCM10009565_86290 [Amycolatopsis albidoflavus]